MDPTWARAKTSFLPACINLDASKAQQGEIRTVPELLEFNANTNPNHLFCVQAEKQVEASDPAFTTITYAQLKQAILRCSAWLSKTVAELSLPYQDSSGVLVRGSPIALFVDSNVGLLIHKLALMCLGVPVLLLSARLSPVAISHLLSKTNSQAIIVSPRLRGTVTEALPLQASSHKPPVLYLQSPYETFLSAEYSEALLGGNVCAPTHFVSENDRNVLILHSSGTTGLPKPIYTSHRHLLGFTTCHDFGKSGQADNLSLSTLPLYHGFGLVTPCLSLGIGLKFCLPASSTIPTGSSTVDLLKRSGANSLLTVPSILEEILILPDEEGIRALKHLQFVAFGGGLPKPSVGETAEKSGIRLLNHYGTTETGPLAPIFVPTPGYNWRYFRLRNDIRRPLELQLEPSLLDDGLQRYKLSMRPFGWPDVFEVQDQLISNPQRPDCDFSAIGRNDDMIVLATGEKVIPRILESTLSQSELVKAAVAFGDGRFEIGVMVEPLTHLTPNRVKDFKSLIWPLVQQAMSKMDAHGQISSEDAIVIATPGSIPRADKGTVLRREAYKVFEKEIAEVYLKLDTAVASIPPLDLAAVEQCLKHLIQTRLNWKVPVDEWTFDDDFFELGMDSLQATRFRRLLLASLPERSTQPGEQSPSPTMDLISRNFVYQHPSVTKMADALKRADASNTPVISQENIRELVDLYSIKRPHEVRQRNGHVIVLTGSTGSLGSYALAHLAELPDVARIICINRRASQDPYVRQEATFRAKGIAMSKYAWAKVLIYQTNSAAPRLGLDDSEYVKLREQTTHILHNAWPMDFNRLLPSFGAQFQILQNLLNLAREVHAMDPLTRPKVLFISSVAAVGNYPKVHSEHIVPETPMHNEECALRLGYAKAKLVCERIIERAVRDYSCEIEAGYVRLGQIAGAQSNGYWNPDEHVAALIKSSQRLGVLPCLHGTQSWLPVDCAARAVSEILLNNGHMDLVYHMENPIRQSWRDTLEILANRLNLPDVVNVPFEMWLEKVRSSTEDGNPAKRLVDFFEQDFERMSRGTLVLSTEKARSASATLRMMTAVSKDTIEAYVDHWRVLGFLE